jgi:hypothetical protein
MCASYFLCNPALSRRWGETLSNPDSIAPLLSLSPPAHKSYPPQSGQRMQHRCNIGALLNMSHSSCKNRFHSVFSGIHRSSDWITAEVENSYFQWNKNGLFLDVLLLPVLQSRRDWIIQPRVGPIREGLPGVTPVQFRNPERVKYKRLTTCDIPRNMLRIFRVY